MSKVRQVVGKVSVEWTEDEPLKWSMTETVGKGRHAENILFSMDLTPLKEGYTDALLIAIKEVWLERAYRVRLQTIDFDFYGVRQVLKTLQERFAQIYNEQGQKQRRFEHINLDLLTGLWAVKQDISDSYLKSFQTLYSRYRDNDRIFAPDLHRGDFPRNSAGEPIGNLGRLRQAVLASALRRATLVEILNVTEATFEAGELRLSIFAFSRLLISRAARPESFRLLRVRDLKIDIVNGQKAYFITITIPKARTHERPEATVPIHRDVGALLERQREAVVRELGHLVEARNATLLQEDENPIDPFTIGDLALFPTGSLRMGQAAKDRLGMIRNSSEFIQRYLNPLKRLTGEKITCRAIRHTMGTQLAVAGCSASTIAAILLHAGDSAARVYVDLAFSDAIDELSNSLEPAFVEHFPVFSFVSSTEAITPAKRIVSTSLDRKHRQTTGECGRTEICQYAPIACYECPRFRPCYDVDHTINLELVQREIDLAHEGGLARRVDASRYRHIANRIRVVINVCEIKRAEIEAQKVSK